MKVLVYVEPVTFRRNPLLLQPWVEWLSDMMRAQTAQPPQLTFAVCSNATLCDLFVERCEQRIAARFVVNQADLLEPFGFRRDHYARDLFDTDDSAVGENDALRTFLNSVQDQFDPDIVISFSENRYLQQSFGGARMLFCELAPLPRLGTAQTLFTDPSGHQTHSMLGSPDLQAGMGLSEMQVSEINSLFTEHIDAQAERHPLGQRVAEWTLSIRGESRIALLALQPEDWLTFEGGYQSIATEGLVMRWLRELPAGWIAVPTYHASGAFSPSMEQTLAAGRSNVVFAPPELSAGLSELFIPHIDGVVTVSSTTALSALLYGKCAVALGNTAFSDLCERRVADMQTSNPVLPELRASLLAFMTHRYCHDLHEFRTRPDYFADFMQRYLRAPDPMRFFTDDSEWRIENLSRHLGIG